MRRSVVVAALATSSIVMADPPPPYLGYAVHVGVSSMVATTGGFGATPSGYGPSIDGEIAWRGSPHITVAVFGAFSTLRSQTDVNDQDTDTRTDARYDVFDLGARVTFHGATGWGPLIGFGLADESIRESGRASQCECENNFCNPCDPIYSNRPYTRWNHDPLLEMHVGTTFPTTGPITLELVALGGISANPDEGGGALFTGRVAIGARY